MEEKQFYSLLEMLRSSDEESKNMALMLIEQLDFQENFIPISLLYRLGNAKGWLENAGVTYQNLLEVYAEERPSLLLSTNDVYMKCIQGGWEKSPHAEKHIKILLKHMNNARVSFMQKAYKIDGLHELIHPIDE
jgi:hypothetical protein